MTSAFVDVTVLPMNQDARLTHRTVIVRGETIESIRPAPEAQVPADAAVIDGRGKYLIPGLPHARGL